MFPRPAGPDEGGAGQGGMATIIRRNLNDVVKGCWRAAPGGPAFDGPDTSEAFSCSSPGRACGPVPTVRRWGEVVRAVGLAGGPVEKHVSGDRLEAGVLGPEPVCGGVTFDVGAVAEQLPFGSWVGRQRG